MEGGGTEIRTVLTEYATLLYITGVHLRKGELWSENHHDRTQNRTGEEEADCCGVDFGEEIGETWQCMYGVDTMDAANAPDTWKSPFISHA